MESLVWWIIIFPLYYYCMLHKYLNIIILIKRTIKWTHPISAALGREQRKTDTSLLNNRAQTQASIFLILPTRWTENLFTLVIPGYCPLLKTESLHNSNYRKIAAIFAEVITIGKGSNEKMILIYLLILT